MPLLMRWPGHIAPGAEVTALTQNIDFAPTFLAAASLAPPAEMQGISLLPLLNGKTPAAWRDALYYHYYEEGEHNVARHEGIRTERYKLIHYYDVDQWELFDLEADPREMMSVYGAPEYAEIQAEMHANLGRLKQAYSVPEGE